MSRKASRCFLGDDPSMHKRSPPHTLLRKNVEPYDALWLAEDRFTDDQLIDFMLQHPILINRPIVTTPRGTRLCRPSEVVLEILTASQKGAFVKEDGEPVIDAAGQRVK
nr:ArsC/Spx/MgsR family protein [Klebsiella pneumoniae]